jgi:hypothetical protein
MKFRIYPTLDTPRDLIQVLAVVTIAIFAWPADGATLTATILAGGEFDLSADTP